MLDWWDHHLKLTPEEKLDFYRPRTGNQYWLTDMLTKRKITWMPNMQHCDIWNKMEKNLRDRSFSLD